MTKDVTRYHFVNPDDGDLRDGSPHPDGEWVRYDDIKHLLAMSPPVTKKWTVTTESLRNLMKNVPGPHDEAIYGSMVRDFIDWVERVLPDDSQVEPNGEWVTSSCLFCGEAREAHQLPNPGEF